MRARCFQVPSNVGWKARLTAEVEQKEQLQQHNQELQQQNAELQRQLAELQQQLAERT
jgi:cell division protein FtsB